MQILGLMISFANMVTFWGIFRNIKDGRCNISSIAALKPSVAMFINAISVATKNILFIPVAIDTVLNASILLVKSGSRHG